MLYGDHKDQGSDSGWKGGILGGSSFPNSAMTKNDDKLDSLAGDKVIMLNSTSKADMKILNNLDEDLIIEEL